MAAPQSHHVSGHRGKLLIGTACFTRYYQVNIHIIMADDTIAALLLDMSIRGKLRLTFRPCPRCIFADSPGHYRRSSRVRPSLPLASPRPWAKSEGCSGSRCGSLSSHFSSALLGWLCLSLHLSLITSLAFSVPCAEHAVLRRLVWPRADIAVGLYSLCVLLILLSQYLRACIIPEQELRKWPVLAFRNPPQTAKTLPFATSRWRLQSPVHEKGA